MAAAIEELSLVLDNWTLIVSSRPSIAEIRRFGRFKVLQLGGFTPEEAAAMLHEYSPGLSEAVIARITEIANGNPLFLRIAAEEFRSSGSLAANNRYAKSPKRSWANSNLAARNSPNSAKLIELLEELALAGGREQVTTLASKLRISEEEAWRLLDAPGVGPLLVLDTSAATAMLFHTAIRGFIVSLRILPPRLRLADLDFGAEEAERDGLLDDSFVQRRGIESIFRQRRSIIIGDRGSGKSAIFRRLSAGTLAVDDQRCIETYPVANTGELMRRMVDKDMWLEVDALRAAWLVIVASVVASTIPESAPKRLRCNAADLRAAFGMATVPQVSPGVRFARLSVSSAVRL